MQNEILANLRTRHFHMIIDMDKEATPLNLFLASSNQPSLSLWNEGRTKQAIIDFVSRVTCSGSPHYVRRPERIAVFDNDGTLWPEKPINFQAVFAINRMKLLAAQHAKWTEAPLSNSTLVGDLERIAAANERQTQEVLAHIHAGLSPDEFEKIIGNWLTTAEHPTFKRRYAELAYRPMQELLAYLRLNGFKTFIVSGGSVEFIRVLAEKMYDIPPEQVIGSSITTRLDLGAGRRRLIKQPRIEFVEDGVGKPSGIDRFIGRRPIFAIGNSDGDQQMLQWVAANDRMGFVGLIHHTDSTREFSYDHEAHRGKLARALLETRARNWAVVDMAKDWERIFS